MNKLILIIVLLFVSSCQSTTPAKSCVIIKMDEWEWHDLLKAASVTGHVTNNCSEDVRYVITEAIGYHASGEVISLDNDVVWNIAPGTSKNFSSILWSSNGIIDLCTANIAEAEY